MIHRLVTLLAALAIAVISTAALAHAAQMSDVPNFGMHAVEMVQAEDIDAVSCGGDQHCGSAMAGFCVFACTALTAIVVSPEAVSDFVFRQVHCDLVAGNGLSAVAPELPKRPPKLRLL